MEVDASRPVADRTGRPLLRRSRHRRPSGEAPPLPRELRASGRFWLIMLLVVVVLFTLGFVVNGTATQVERFDTAILEQVARIRTPTLTRIARAIDSLGSSNVNLVLRWATIVLLAIFRRWRHLFTFIAAVLMVGWVGTTLTEVVGRPRPLNVPILGEWSGFSMPSAPLAALSATLLGMGFVLLVDGPWRNTWFWGADVVIGTLGLARIYLASDHPTDALFGVTLGMGIVVLVFRLATPEDVFPVTYRKGRAAHLDVGGPRGEAIRRAVQDQLGLEVLDVKPFGQEGSGGSTPLRLKVAGVPDTHLFAKLYAANHLRADRNYKFIRTILYGRLEDEKPFRSVRQLVQYEDYMLRVMRDAGLPVAATFGFVEITPVREYLIATEFLEGAKEISEVPVDLPVIDSALRLVRKLWDAGLAHRDIKPANILVRDGEAFLIDVAFAEVRPTPWRQAVDLANMMLLLGLYSDTKTVYERASKLFAPEELAEAFAAARGVATPSQLRAELKKSDRSLLAEYRSLAPPRRPIPIQRWSLRRVAITVCTLIVGLMVLILVISNLQGAGLL